MFVAMLRTTPVTRAGSGRGRVRSPGRINLLLAAVRECYKHAVANGAVEPSVLAFLYEVGDDRHLPAELRPEGSGLRYRARPRHVQRTRRGTRPVPVRREEVEALLGARRTWRDRLPTLNCAAFKSPHCIHGCDGWPMTPTGPGTIATWRG